MQSAKYFVLRELELFRSLDKTQIDQIAFHAEFKKYSKGEYLFQPGDEISDVYIVRQGSIKSGIGSTENKSIIKEIVYQNEILGENILTGDKQRKEFAKALTDTETLNIPVSFFKDLLEKNPQLCQELTFILINKISNLEKRMSNFVFKKAQSRIVDFLKKLAQTQGIKIGIDEILINHGLSHKEIANITETSRQTVARVLGELKRQNIIHFSPRKPHKILIRNVMNLS